MRLYREKVAFGGLRHCKVSTYILGFRVIAVYVMIIGGKNCTHMRTVCILCGCSWKMSDKVHPQLYFS